MGARPSPGSYSGPAPGRSTTSRPRLPHAERAARVRFRRAVALMLMTLILPGSAQIVAGDKRVGRFALWTWFTVMVAGGVVVVVSLVHHEVALNIATNATLLGVARVVLPALAVGWAALFMDAWRIGQPLSLQQRHRLTVVGLNGLLSFSVAGALLFGAHVVGVQRDFLMMFGTGDASGAHDGRYNILLLGGDSGVGRWGLRPDSMTVASIDAETGKTVLIGLPRNLENFHFAPGSVMDKQFPHGFDCEGCYLNGVSTWAGDHTNLFRHSKNPGVDATIMAIEGVTGLQVNYWAMVNLKGFKDLVDAFGGVTLRVRQPIPVGGLGDDVTGYIKPGLRKLNGHDALWFARAREGSDDYSRMARQKCVMNAMLHQISPQTALTNFERIAKATTGMVTTDVPRSEVDRFVGLAMKARSQPVATVSLVPPAINTADPDLALIKKMIADAVDRSEHPGSGAAAKHKQRGTVTGGSLGSRDQGYTANQSEDLGAAC